MLFYSASLAQYSIEAKDGSIGKVEDVYFDEENWTIRYLVVNTNPWLPGRKVLITPISIEKVDTLLRQVYVDLTKEQVKESPDADTEKPVSKKFERKLLDYYGYPYYWHGQGVWGGQPSPRLLMNVPQYAGMRDGHNEDDDSSDDRILHSGKELTGSFNGYSIRTKGESFGQVVDFIIEDETWKVRYFLVEMKKWMPSKEVILSPNWIESIVWENKEIQMGITKEQVEQAPEFIKNKTELDKEYERSLFGYYNRQYDWD
ncbi:PRC-barrel domain-containing protein [Bacillus alkalicellulosilyticus]|uniref:PRC-barrel domain-containing protein n=1 Tax=Alkalihalobacterium alkalicellulosilyticum TaxID=1912214 RepID=UPI000996BC52|nr:PRC-barrel domain-containing protein [Bacillus alkalicellulosilyticus]